MGHDLLSPPLLTPDILVRSALVERLRARRHRRVVTLVAGPGFGKSTLMAQAHAVNRLAPDGTDRWLRCEPHDAIGSRFVTGLAASIGADIDRLRHDNDGAMDELCAHIALTWPDGLALFLDDVHHLDGSGADLLRRLVHDAPANLHLVLSSRQSIAGLALWHSRGEVVELGEDDLRLSDDEVAQMADHHHLPVELLRSAAGWPALTDVLARQQPASLAGWETALQGLDARDRRAVAELVAVGGGTIPVLETVLSDPPELTALVRGLPLMALHADDTVVPHQLWERIIEGHLTDEEARATQTRMACSLLVGDDLERAAALAIEAESWDTLRAVFVSACSRGHAGPPSDVLAAWIQIIPPDLEGSAEVDLLRAVVGRAVDPFGAETRELLDAAIGGFRAAGDLMGEVAALAEYTHVVRLRGELELLQPVIDRFAQLDAAGLPEAEGPTRLVRAIAAELSGSDEQALAELDAILPGSLSAEWAATVEYLRSQALLDLGRTGEAVSAADRSVAQDGTFIGGYYVARVMRWYDGDPTEALELPPADSHPGATPVDRLHAGIYTALVHAFAGDPTRAAAALEVAEHASSDELRPMLRAELAGSRAALDVARGDDVRAGQVLADALADLPVDHPPARSGYLRFLGLVYVLCPDARASLDADDLGPSHRATRQLARLLVSVRAGAIPEDLPPLVSSAEELASRLPLQWATELAAILSDAGRAEGRGLAAALAELHGTRFRDALRAAAGAQVPGASRLLRSVTIDTGASIDIAVLGPTELRVDGAAGLDGGWRRRAVRVLLTHLAGRGELSREELHVLLWPDADQAGAERNLRATLSHLVRLLEPHRPADEAPFIVRSEHERIVLVGPPHVEVDAVRFERLLDEAEAVRTTTPSAALERYRAALELWRGEPFEELPAGGWVVHERDRLRQRFVEASLRTAEIHLAAGEPADALARAFDCLQVEPWSEEAHRLLIASHLAAGDLASARRAADRTIATLTELGVGPAPETRMVLELVEARES